MKVLWTFNSVAAQCPIPKHMAIHGDMGGNGRWRRRLRAGKKRILTKKAHTLFFPYTS